MGTVKEYLANKAQEWGHPADKEKRWESSKDDYVQRMLAKDESEVTIIPLTDADMKEMAFMAESAIKILPRATRSAGLIISRHPYAERGEQRYNVSVSRATVAKKGGAKHSESSRLKGFKATGWPIW